MIESGYEELFLRVDGVEYDLLMRDQRDEHGCSVNVLAEGADWGSRETRLTTLTTMMRHGDRVSYGGSGNRKPTLNLQISGPDLAALAWTEETYQRATGRPAELVWQPPDFSAERCVFDVVWSNMPFKLDDLGELRCTRSFTLELQALPFVRPELPVVLEGVLSEDGGGDVTVFDDGSALTDWTSLTGSLSVVSGAIVETQATDPNIIMRLSGAMLVEPGLFVAVDWAGGLGYPIVRGLSSMDGVWRHLEYAGSVAHASGQRSFYRTPYRILGRAADGTYWPPGSEVFAGLEFDATRAAPSGAWSFSIDRVARVSAAALNRQQTLTITPGGSAPTQGSLHVRHDTDPLGLVLMATGPVGEWSPPLSSTWVWWGSGVRTTDAFSPSGYVWDIDLIPFEAQQPPQPTEAAALWVLIKSSTAGIIRLDVTTDSWMLGTKLGGGQSEIATINIANADTWELHPLGIIPTPPTKIGPGGTAIVTVKRHLDAPLGGGLTLDVRDVYLCPAGDDYGLTVVNVPHKHLWINAPTAEEPNGSMMMGDADDGSDAYYPTGPGPASIGAGQNAQPEGMQVFALTAGATGAYVDLSAFPRHMHHVTRHPSLDEPVE